MRITAQLSMWLCVAFGLVCLGFALSGFFGAASISDAAERELSLGYAGFWAFLAAIAVVFGVLSWLMVKGKLGAAE